MKEKFERFKNEKIVINVRSQKQYDEFMIICEKQGLQWNGWGLPTNINYYNDYEEETCINLNNLNNLSYGDINFYKNNDYKIITYKEFIKEESSQFTKSDLKDNHIVVLRNYDRRAWYCIGYSYDDNLINIGINCNELYDIMEVWEFDKLVWKREEKPVEILDKVERNYLSGLVGPWKNRVNYIYKETPYKETPYMDVKNEYIIIAYSENNNVCLMSLPNFKKGTMYKNMEIYKEYSLKELGLE